VPYNLVLELNPEQKQRLKMTAFTARKSIRGFVTDLVVEAIGTEPSTPSHSSHSPKPTKIKNKKQEVQ
jgi:hypothetical protein